MATYARWDEVYAPPRRSGGGLPWLVAGLIAVVGGIALHAAAPPSAPLPPVTPEALRNAGDPGALPHPYISLELKTIVDPKIYRSGRGYKNRPWQAYYYLLPVGDLYVVATSDTPIRPGLIQGKVVKWDAPVNMGALQEVYRRYPAYRSKIAAVQVNVGDYVGPPTVRGWQLLGVLIVLGGAIAAVVGLYKLFTAAPAPAPAPAPADAPRWFQPR
jgi:hypothetical protein